MRSSSWQPTDIADVTGPGTAMTVRPSNRARPAVFRAPLRMFASTTSVPRVTAAMTRLRTRNRWRCGSEPGGHSDSSSPRSPMRSNSAAWAAG